MEVIQEMGRSILIVEDLTRKEDAYKRQMLTYNRIPGIVSCQKGLHDNKEVLKYDITNMKPLERLYESGQLEFKDLRHLLREINSIIIGGRSFLLEDSGYLMSPEYIYKNLEDDNYYLIYIPYSMDKDYYSGSYSHFHEMADYFIDRINHKDEKAVNVAYQFYRMSKESLFSLDAFIAVIERENNNSKVSMENKKELHIRDEGLANQVLFDFDEDLTEVEDDTEIKMPSYKIPIIMGCIILIVATLYFLIPDAKQLTSQIIITEILLIITGLILVIRNVLISIKNKNNKIEMPKERVTVDEYWSGDGETMFFSPAGADSDNEETQFFDMTPEIKHKLSWEENGSMRVRELTKEDNLIGKKYEEVDLCISDPTISRKHARLIIDKKGLFLQDLDSTNGTFVNGNRILPGENVKIDESSEIRFGKVLISVV